MLRHRLIFNLSEFPNGPFHSSDDYLETDHFVPRESLVDFLSHDFRALTTPASLLNALDFSAH